MIVTEYHIWGIPPGLQQRRKLIAIFEEHRWQWAEKLYQYLLDQDYQDVELKEMEVLKKSPRGMR